MSGLLEQCAEPKSHFTSVLMFSLFAATGSSRSLFALIVWQAIFIHMLFFPTKYPEGEWNPRQLEFEDVWLNSGLSTKIHGWYCPCSNPRAHLLYLHGNAGNITDRTDLLFRFQQLGIAVLIIDYRGYGRSNGRSTIFSVTKDAIAAAKFLADTADTSVEGLFFMGRSLGGALAIQLAAKLQPKGLIVESTFTSLRKIAGYHYSALSWFVPANILNSTATIQKYNGKILLSHGENDFTIPFDHGVEICDSANSPKTFIAIPNVGHNGPLPEDYYDTLSQFIDT